MTTQTNLRTNVTAWLKSHDPYFIGSVSAALGGILGLLLGGGLGVLFFGLEAGFGGAIVGAVVGVVIGFLSVQLAMALLGLLLIIVFPSRCIYLAIAGVVGVVGAFVRGQQLGYSITEYAVAAAGYGVLMLIFCEICHGLWAFVQPSVSHGDGLPSDGVGTTPDNAGHSPPDRSGFLNTR